MPKTGVSNEPPESIRALGVHEAVHEHSRYAASTTLHEHMERMLKAGQKEQNGTGRDIGLKKTGPGHDTTQSYVARWCCGLLALIRQHRPAPSAIRGGQRWNEARALCGWRR